MVAIKNQDADAFVARPNPAQPVVLVFGPDAGLVHERAEKIINVSVADVNDPFALVRIEGDGALSTFDRPARAVNCATAILRALTSLGLEIRAGLHTGEIELAATGAEGIAVHIGARVASLAAPGEVLTSSTVKDLVVGSGIAFVDRGSHALKGVPGEWQLYAVDGAASGA